MVINISARELNSFLKLWKTDGQPETLEAVLDTREDDRLKNIENHLSKLSGSYEMLANKMHEPALGRMPDQELIERIAERTVAMITNKVEEDQGKADEELAEMVSNLTFQKVLETLVVNGRPKHPEITPVGILGKPEKAPGDISEISEKAPGENPERCENAAEFYESCVSAAAADAAPFDDSADTITDALEGFEPFRVAHEEPTTAAEEEKALVLEETGGETAGEMFEVEPVEEPVGDYVNEIKKPAVVLGPKDFPTYDASTEMYMVRGQAYIAKELWLQKKYIDFFNAEIVKLLKEGKSRQYIADRFKVTGTSITNRIRKYHLA